MPFLTFRDLTDRTWFVSEVRPLRPLDFERLKEFQGGWLVFFRPDGDRRRVAPIPEGWENLDEAGLCALLPRRDQSVLRSPPLLSRSGSRPNIISLPSSTDG
jgi:hypothetical protein